jgi:hypothetical protein
LYARLLRKLSNGLTATGIPYMEYVERWLAEFEGLMDVPYRERFRGIVSDATG